MTKRKSKGKALSNSQKRSAAIIKRATYFCDEERFDEAVNLLSHHADRYPMDTDVLECWFDIIYEDGNGVEIWDVARRLYKIDSRNVEYVIGLFNACLSIPMPFTALHLVEIHTEQLRDHDDFELAFEQYYALLMEVRNQLMEQLQDTDGLTTTHLRDIEELRSLYLIRAFDQAQTLATKLWDDFPDPVLLRTTISDGYAIQGDYAEAARLAQEALDYAPDDFEAFGNFIIYMFKHGRLDDISDRIDMLRAKTEFELTSELTLALEIWAWLGDDTMVTQLYEAHRDMPAVDHSLMIHHMAAASYAFLGDVKQAKKLWRKAHKLDPNIEIVNENLDDLQQPLGQRHGPWHFESTEWFPTEWAKKIVKALSAPTERQLQRALQQFYDDMPALQFIIPHILERGDPLIVNFAFQIATQLKLPIIANFALNQRGSDDMRLEAANMAARNGLLPRGKPMQLYIKGALDDVILMAYRIHGELAGKPPPRAIRSIMQDAHNLIQRERYDSALTLVMDGLEKAPDDPTLLNYLATIHRAKGQRMEEEAVIRHTFEVHPGYFFGRCSMMELYAREGNFEAADALLEPMLERESFHYSEFGIFCRAHVALLTAKGEFKSAHSWLDMWERIHPELIEIKKIRREVNIAKRNARTASE
jgi:tetratricopeptide (TPR) repeat protein